MASSSTSNPPCAACKFLRRKCTSSCIFSPYFPPEDPQKFINVHRIFGASNAGKILGEVVPDRREDAVNSLAYEAEARVRDPVYGCVGIISALQRQVASLQRELDAANAELMFRYACGEMVMMNEFWFREDFSRQVRGGEGGSCGRRENDFWSYFPNGDDRM